MTQGRASTLWPATLVVKIGCALAITIAGLYAGGRHLLVQGAYERCLQGRQQVEASKCQCIAENMVERLGRYMFLDILFGSPIRLDPNDWRQIHAQCGVDPAVVVPTKSKGPGTDYLGREVSRHVAASRIGLRDAPLMFAQFKLQSPQPNGRYAARRSNSNCIAYCAMSCA